VDALGHIAAANVAYLDRSHHRSPFEKRWWIV